MNSFLSYNLLSDGNSIDPVPTQNFTVDELTIFNGMIDYFYISKDVDFEYAEPLSWDDDTIAFADYDYTLNAGNLPQGTLDFTHISIVRNDGDGWKVLSSKPISALADIGFEYIDNVPVNGLTKYAFLRIQNGQMKTIAGLITETNLCFNFCYLSERTDTKKLYIDVNYSDTQRVNPNSVFEPIGRKYPIYISNAVTNYQSGRISTNYLNHEYIKNGLSFHNRNLIRRDREEFLNFLMDDNAKLYKDWNSNAWLIMVHGNPSIGYTNTSANGLANIEFSYVQIGDIDNPNDWVEFSLIDGYYEHLTGE